MRRLGKTLHELRSGLVVVKPVASLRPEGLLQLKVYNRDGKEVGEVFDVIGSTKSPYVVVKVHGASPDKELYVEEPRGAKSASRGGRRGGGRH